MSLERTGLKKGMSEEEKMARKEKIDALERKHWRSSGDVPYDIAESLEKTGASLLARVPQVVKEILLEKGQEYEAQHIQAVGFNTRYYSPGLVREIARRIYKFYGIPFKKYVVNRGGSDTDPESFKAE